MFPKNIEDPDFLFITLCVVLLSYTVYVVCYT